MIVCMKGSESSPSGFEKFFSEPLSAGNLFTNWQRNAFFPPLVRNKPCFICGTVSSSCGFFSEPLLHLNQQNQRLMIGGQVTNIWLKNENEGGLGPMWTRSNMEAPAGIQNMGGWMQRVYTQEQQQRLGVNLYREVNLLHPFSRTFDATRPAVQVKISKFPDEEDI